MDHDRSSPGIEGQGHRSRSRLRVKVAVRMCQHGRSDFHLRARAVCFPVNKVTRFIVPAKFDAEGGCTDVHQSLGNGNRPT